MTLHIPFDNSYAALPPRFYTRQVAQPVTAPRLLVFNHALAADLGITPGDPDEMASVFAGNAVPDGAAPLAQVYAGHQFGGFSPQLGDGRALLLGEVVNIHGQRRDIQLKGSGQTPYSRMGDGRAWLGPVLREYLLSEAMHALGVPTTRALAAVLTGERVYREAALPGAVLTRVAASHIRVGTFQYFAARRDIDALQALYEHTRTRHYPEADSPAQMLKAVIAAQAKLVARWLSIGFIHGVMNTDNTSLSGETIDYGPAAYMDSYHPVTVYSSIDAHGRYAYDNQANVIVWNMAQLATALVPLMPDTDAAIAAFTAAINAMPAQIEADRLTAFRPKLGLTGDDPADAALIADLLALMQAGQADFTNTFRALAHGNARDQFTDRAAYDVWHARWQDRLHGESGVEARMLSANPAYIPRNHRVEEMIKAAVAGDMAPFERLLRVLSDPFTDQPGAEDLTRPPLSHEVVAQTFCGT
ncbi:YdiU family protein [Seohaeicola sp. SP36]|uniref:protein adenylyltransferase SelO n=1 Tax=unclassified Seohaeicola TaxID=2641111 RepID=UPI00237AF4D9|nr:MULTISPECIES: YdiU family protein [unclassified Seohaeicola]MDD9706060.1 YdiU family protein [Seohaeicola sp. 4SK31]MDD9734519.1 YdiU family protein [Seohaeicola sp. SP36]